jgi:hypothetical protein
MGSSKNDVAEEVSANAFFRNKGNEKSMVKYGKY